MNKNTFLSEYFFEYKDNLINDSLFDQLIELEKIYRACNEKNSKLIFAGNGASAAIASHAALDFSKQANIRAVTFHDPALISALSNDFGYERFLERAISMYANEGDVVTLISVSGESPNILAAADFCKQNDLKVVTFSGRHSDNTLASKGDLNFWVNSHAYNVVEGLHMIWLLSVVDLILGKKEYEVKG